MRWSEVGIVNACIPFPTWHLRSGKWGSNKNSHFWNILHQRNSLLRLARLDRSVVVEAAATKINRSIGSWTWGRNGIGGESLHFWFGFYLSNILWLNLYFLTMLLPIAIQTLLKGHKLLLNVRGHNRGMSHFFLFLQEKPIIKISQRWKAGNESV